MNSEIEAVFRGAFVPEWLRQFEVEPLVAIADLLVGRAPLGTLAVEEPSVLLVDWLSSLGDRGGFASRVDRALAVWIEGSWGNPTLELARQSTALTAVAWCRIATVIAMDSRMGEAADRLRLHVLNDQWFLENISQGRGRDPMGLAWMALARHQSDRTLIDYWWDLCSVPPNKPWYRCGYGVHGLRGLPPTHPSRAGRFPEEVAEGLALLAWGLRHNVKSGWLDESVAASEFMRIARLTIAAYPFPDHWRSFWRHALERDERMKRPPIDWIRKVASLPDSAINPGEVTRLKSKGREWRVPDHSWLQAVTEITQQWKAGVWDAWEDAERLIGDQAEFARATGDTYFIERTTFKLGKIVQSRRPDLALKWSALAIKVAPWNSHNWTLNAATLRHLKRFEEALVMATKAVQRFPNDVYTRNELAEVLVALGRVEEAEVTYREAVARFPNNTYARNRLAEMLRKLGRLEEAEVAYREATALSPRKAYSWNGRAAVLRDLGRLEEAEAAYREAVRRFPDDVVALDGLAWICRKLGRLEEAEAIYREATALSPRKAYSWNGRAAVLKDLGRLEEAEAAYREAAKRFPSNFQTRNGLIAVLRELGRLEEAEATYREAVSRSPDNIYARITLATVLVTLGRPKEAEKIYVEAIARFPGDVHLQNALAAVRVALRRSEEVDQEAAVHLPSDIDSHSKLLEVLEEGHMEEADADYDTPLPQDAVAVPSGNELHPDDLSILLADAYLLRQWASHQHASRGTSVELPTGSLRGRASSLLERLISFGATQAGAAAEAGLLRMTFGELNDAVRLMQAASQRFPNNPRIRYTLARAVRSQAKAEQRRLSADAEKEVITPWRHLGGLNETSRPLQFLGEGRAWLALTDGVTVEENARAALGRLGYWVNLQEIRSQATAYPDNQSLNSPASENLGDSFYGWWANEIHAYVFGSEIVRGASDLGDLGIIRERLLINSDLIDRIEEEYVMRLDQP